MITEAEMGGHCVHRIYVDGGSTSEILYEHCFSKFRPEIINQLVPANTPVVRFSREIIWPLGQISLLVMVGDEEHSTPRVRKIRAIPSTAHGMINIPMAGRIVTLQSSRIIPLECSMVSEPGVPRSAINQVREEKIQVAIHPEHPKQTIAIGSTLTEEGRKELCRLLRRHLDVFAWKPADMTGFPRYIAEHRLNVREGCLPVRQKKRGQAPERNKAISEEVKKLVEADIMKEVHYHSWLSNPVLLKKHDDSWRMCVDFKDLNKACPKDGYPLSKIDWKVESLCGIQSGCGWTERVPGQSKSGPRSTVPKVFKDVQKLNVKLASLNRFLSKSAEKSLPFFKTLKKCTKKSDFQWTPKAEGAFKEMKQSIAELLMLTAPKEKEELIMYLAAAKEAIIAVLITGRDGKEELPDPWILFTDGSSCVDGSEAGLIIMNLEGMEFTYASRFRFNATNNEAEYEALIAGLQITSQMGIQNLQANVDSKVVANQKADSLSKIASTSFAHLSKQVLVEELREKVIDEKEILAVVEEEGYTWMTPVYEYLTEGILPEEEKEIKDCAPQGRKICRDKRSVIEKSFLGPWLRCVGPLQANYVRREIHEGSCSMHAGPRSVVAKALSSGYFWPTMHTDARNLIRECKDCQSSNGETPFSLTYGEKAVIPAEIGMPTLRTVKVDMVKNNKALGISLDLLEKKKEKPAIQEARNKAKMEGYYNARVRSTSFRLGDFVYRNNEASHAEDGGKLEPKWKGPYKVTEELEKGAHRLRDHNGHTLPRTWNICNLKKCYMHEM
nr:reverse transcriptase domain-containing protein [Tanacetum cinerariifolium]